MIIAQIVERDYVGGTERLATQIAQELKRRGHTPIMLWPTHGGRESWLGNVLDSLDIQWDTVPGRLMFDPRTVTDVMGFIRKHRVDVVHSHEFTPSVYGAVASWLLRRPHVITMHSNLYFATAWRRRVAFSWAVRHSTGVVAVSGDTRDDAERLLRLEPRTVRVIPNGVAARTGRRELLRTELNLADDDLLVVALGNLAPRKAHRVLLRALIAVRDRRPELPWHLAVAGADHGSAPELRQIAAEHGVEARFHLLGERSDPENVLAASDVFAMSSLHEGMPLAIMEAMFACKPVISSTAGGIAEMITQDVDGLLTPVDDVASMSEGLERLLSDSALRARIGTAGRARAERQFSVSRMVDDYFSLYTRGAPTPT